MKEKNNKDNNTLVEESQDTINDNQQKIENKIDNKLIIENNSNIEEETKEKLNKKLVIISKYSNLDPRSFTNEYILDYKCISCGLIPSYEKANEIICCGNLICEECLKKLKEDKKGCSICNIEELKVRSIKNENKIFYKSFKSLLIKCPYTCDWTGMWVDLDTHLLECKFGFRECKYKIIGCEYADNNQKVKEHEESNDNLHLNLAMKFVKDHKIEKKKIKFELGETVMTTVHPHKMTYKTSSDWYCDGRRLEHGCFSRNFIFPVTKPRFRCDECDFDLCDKCIVHYLP